MKQAIICSILIAYGILIGSPLKDNTQTINLIIMLTSLIYIIYKIIREKEYKIIKRKIDIYVLILVLSSYISLILNTYSNLEATIEYIIKYTAILGIYIIIRDFVVENQNNKNVIINTLLISGILIFIQGIDNITYNLSEKFINITGNVVISNQDKRFIGIFGYANTLAIYMLIIAIFAIKEYKENKGKINKIFYATTFIISNIAIIFSYSRGVWILTAITYVVMLIFNLHKKKYFKSKIKKQVLIILILIGSLVFIVTILIGLKLTEPLELFNDVNIKEKYVQKISSAKPNEKYEIIFDIDSKVAYNIEENYEIEIDEINKYDDIIAVHKITFGNFNGQKKIEFESQASTYRMTINFKTLKRTTQRGLTINQLKINDKEIVLKYKYLPKSLVEKFQDIRINTTSVVQRTEYMKDTCKLIMKYGIFGIGADGWRDTISEVQENEYYARECHSYILEIFSEFGIIGFIGILGIFINILRTKEKDIYIRIALIVLMLHSCIDFDLSFMYMLIIFFTMIACTDFQTEDKKTHEIISRIITIIILFIAIYYDLKIFVFQFIKKQDNPYSTEYIINQLDIQNEEKFCEDIEKVKSRRKNILYEEVWTDLLQKDLTEKEIDKIFEIIKRDRDVQKYNFKSRLMQIENLREIKNKSKNTEIINECDEIINQETKEMLNLLQNTEKFRVDVNEKENYIEYLEKRN